MNYFLPALSLLTATYSVRVFNEATDCVARACIDVHTPSKEASTPTALACVVIRAATYGSLVELLSVRRTPYSKRTSGGTKGP